MRPSWVLCLRFPELKRLLDQGPIRKLLVSSPLRSSRYLQLDASAGSHSPAGRARPAPWRPGSGARELSTLELRSRFQPLQDLHVCQEASPRGRCAQLPPQCCWGAGPGQGVGQSTQLLRACYLTPGLCPHSDRADSPKDQPLGSFPTP